MKQPPEITESQNTALGNPIRFPFKAKCCKGLLIFGAAAAVAVQVVWRVSNVEVPIFETMGIAAILNLGANLLCLRLLYPYRNGDVNMTSVWECSRNDVMEGLAVIVATLAVWAFSSGWPDILIAIALVILFLRSASRVLRSAWRELYPRSAEV